MALRHLAEGPLDLTLIAPEADFSLRPLTVAYPFSRGHQETLPLAEIMAEQGGTFIRDAVAEIDADKQCVVCVSGARIPYDELVLVPGARAVEPFASGLTFGLTADPAALNGLLADLEQGYTKSVAFVVPDGCSWPLPLYELALMTAEEVWGMGMDDVDLHLLTPEPEPLAIFGTEASVALTGLLEDAGIHVRVGVHARVGRDQVILGPDDRLDVLRTVTLPVLTGPRLAGVPSDAEGFIPVDPYGRVTGLAHVHAAGDATDQPIKQGGLACQQAVVVATDIAAAAGAAVTVEPFTPVLRGRLLTGRRDRFLVRDVAMRDGKASDKPLWWPPAKVTSRYLAPYLQGKGLVDPPLHHGAAEPTPPDEGVEVAHSIPCNRHYAGDVLGLDTLGSVR